MTDDVAARARAALEGVTRGPWTVLSGAWGNVWHFPEGDHNDGRPTVVVRVGGMTEADSTFIAAARSLVPELLAEVERLRGALEAVEARNLRQTDTIDRARFSLGEAWDDGNACGLDGWVGPGRDAGEVDDEAVRARDRCIDKLLRGDQ